MDNEKVKLDEESMKQQAHYNEMERIKTDLWGCGCSVILFFLFFGSIWIFLYG